MKCFLLIPLLLSSVAFTAETGPLAPAGLRCEYLKNPMGVDVAQPRFFWTLRHTERSQTQTAYQIVVDNGWDSGKIASEQSIQVVYSGPALKSGATYQWKVRYWDKDGRPSPYSATASFDTGLLSPSDWRGNWIAGGNQLRKEFRLAAAPVRARAYLCGLGYAEFHINGKKVGNHVLDPAWTTFSKRDLYVTYDVTRFLHKGENAVGIMLGQGWYHDRAAILQMSIELDGGQKVEIATDGSWKATQGPILEDSVYNGEVYDARRETPGWDMPGYSNAGWSEAKVVDGPKGVLSSQMMPPIRVTMDLPPLKVTNPKPGVFVYDLGQNISGWVRLKVSGPSGTKARLRHSELLYDNGMLNTENLRAAKATDVYILKGDGEEEVYEPRFTYHGFRYVELTGYPGAPKLDSILGRVVHSDVKPAGGFVCSKPILNQIQRQLLWSTQANLFSVPTDCDQRDERRGWTADAHLNAETAILNYDMPAFDSNFVRDMRDNQELHSDGSISDTIPNQGSATSPADPAWGAAYPIFVWYTYERYGDKRILSESYDGIKLWADSLKAKAHDGILDFSKYGDWVPIQHTPNNLVSTFYYCLSVDIVAQAADVLGKTGDAETYHKLGQDIRAAFHKKFYNAEQGYYANGTQTANALPIYLDMVPKDAIRRVGGYLRNDITYYENTHLTTGIVGTRYLLPVLTMLGDPELAYELATQTTYPSWGYMIDNGATTLWELWQNKTGPSMNSHNHQMFGSIGAWFYETLAGINYDPKDPGYHHILFTPKMVRDLNWVSASYDSVRGTVASSWKRSDGHVRLDVEIPVGSTAEVTIPKVLMGNVQVAEGGQVLWKARAYQAGVAGVTSAHETREAVVVECGSGHYAFDLTGE